MPHIPPTKSDMMDANGNAMVTGGMVDKEIQTVKAAFSENDIDERETDSNSEMTSLTNGSHSVRSGHVDGTHDQRDLCPNIAANQFSMKGKNVLNTVKPLYFASHLIGDFRELIKIAKFNGRENGRKYVKL